MILDISGGLVILVRIWTAGERTSAVLGAVVLAGLTLVCKRLRFGEGERRFTWTTTVNGVAIRSKGTDLFLLEQPQARYRRWVERGMSDPELQFIRAAVQRNHLTGSERFILEVEQRIGERILYRDRGRPRSGA